MHDVLIGIPLTETSFDTMDAQERSELTTRAQDESDMEHSADIELVPFEDMTMGDVLRMVTAVLNEIVSGNDKLQFNPNKLTRFHSRVPPGISIKDYLLRIVRFCSLDPAILIVVVYFIDLLASSFENFIVNSLTVHRFLITSVTIASKGLCDSFCTNAHYAKVGGLQQMELNLLEVEFLTRISYRIVPDAKVFNDYYMFMFTRHGAKILQSKKSVDSLRTLASSQVRPPKPQLAQQPQQQFSTPTPPHDEQSTSDEPKNTFTRKMKNMFNPMRKRGSEGAITIDTKRSKQ